MILVKTFRTLTLVMLLLGITGISLAQQKEVKSFTLKEAQDYAIQNSYTSKNANIDVQMAKKKVWETTAIGLPQINASLQYQDMVDIPTTLIPGEFFDRPGENIAVKFGTQHNTTLGATLSQLLFNGQYIVGLQAVKTFYDMTNENKEKTDIETRQGVANVYTLLSVYKENKKVLDGMLPTTERMVFEADESFKNGLIDDITRDQVKLNLTNIINNISVLERNIAYTERLLKFQMGLDESETITLKDTLKGLISLINLNPIMVTGLKLDNHIDFKIIKTNEKLQWLNLKREQSTYLPVLSGFINYQQRAMRNDFDMFDSKGIWFPTNIIGLQLDIPIFSSGMKSSRVQQARLTLEKAQNTSKQVAQGLELAAEQSRTNFNSALDKFNREKDNYILAENIFKKTNIKFKEGIASSTEVTQATNQFLSSETSYYSSIYDLLIAKINYDKAVNNQ